MIDGLLAQPLACRRLPNGMSQLPMAGFQYLGSCLVWPSVEFLILFSGY